MCEYQRGEDVFFLFPGYVEMFESLWESVERVAVDVAPNFIFRANFLVANTFPIALRIFAISFEFFSIGWTSQA